MDELLDCKLIWEKAQPEIKEGMTEMSYSLWISGLEPVCILSDMLILQSMNEVTLDTLKSLYSDQIADALSHASGVNLRPMFICGDERPKYEKLMAEKKRRSESLLDPRFTFDTFVIGGSNNIAYAAAKAVAAQPAKAFNPLYIYGDVGLGKTHLMHAIGNKIKEDNPSARITYVTSETFTNELIQSIQDNTNAQFRNKYRNVDVLMIDDVQFIAGKNTTQEEFFNTFNTLHTSGRQIVISSDKPPKEIPALEERLIHDGKSDEAATVRAVADMADVFFLRQKETKGLGHAVWRAKSFVGNEPFAVLLGDDIMLSEKPVLKQLVEAAEANSCSAVAVREVPDELITKYSSVKLIEQLSERVYKIGDMNEKPTLEEKFSNFAILGRYVLTPAIFDILEHTAPGRNNEIQLTDGMKELCLHEPMCAVDFEGRRYDTGNLKGYLEAIIDFALKNDEAGEWLRQFIIDKAELLK